MFDRPEISVSRTLPSLIALSGFALAFAVAAGHANGAAPHVHGLAQLQVGIEGDSLELMFVSPAANLVGFEHAPRTDEEHHTIQETFDFFRVQPLLESSNASCAIAQVSISGGLAENESHDEHTHEHHHKGGDAGEASHNQAHEASLQEQGQQPSAHSDVMVTQVLNCDSGWREGLRTTVLEQFGGIESLQVQWAGESGQGSAILSQGAPALEL